MTTDIKLKPETVMKIHLKYTGGDADDGLMSMKSMMDVYHGVSMIPRLLNSEQLEKRGNPNFEIQIVSAQQNCVVIEAVITQISGLVLDIENIASIAETIQSVFDWMDNVDGKSVFALGVVTVCLCLFKPLKNRQAKKLEGTVTKVSNSSINIDNSTDNTNNSINITNSTIHINMSENKSDAGPPTVDFSILKKPDKPTKMWTILSHGQVSNVYLDSEFYQSYDEASSEKYVGEARLLGDRHFVVLTNIREYPPNTINSQNNNERKGKK
jgi:hypothetical protein